MGSVLDNLTVNYGLRYDAFSAFDAENQLSPRVNVVWTPTDTTTIHAGYARYFSPPPFELVASQDRRAVRQHHGGGGDHTDDTPKAERADYYDVGVEQKLFGDWTVGLDSFYKTSQQPDRRRPVRRADHPDAVQLCQPGGSMAAKFTAQLSTSDNFTAYVNAAYERAVGKNIVSSQFQFDPGDLAYIANHFIPLDHQQIGYGVGGRILQLGRSTHVRADLLYGTGLRRDGATPNGDHVPDYVTVNLGRQPGLSRWRAGRGLTARFDVHQCLRREI